MHPVGNISHIAFQASPAGKITTWNTECEKFLGYTASDVLLKPMAHLVADSIKEKVKAQIHESRGNASTIPVEAVHADGRVSSLYMTVLPQFRRGGGFGGFSVTLESRLARGTSIEETLIDEEQFKKFLDCLACTFYVTDQNGHFLLWNKKVETVSQRTFEEVRRSNALDFFHDDYKEVVEKKLRDVFEHGEATVEADIVTKDGTRIPYLLVSSRIELSNVRYCCGMGLDISERRRHEERLFLRERALHATLNGIVISRCNGRDSPIDYVNPAFERITGYRADEVIGRDSRFMAAPGLDDNERQNLRRAIDERRETHVVFRNLRKNGEVFWNELTIAPVKNAKGETTHFIGVINDVTASKQRTSILEHEANHDALTGVANRTLFRDRLEQALYLGLRNKTLVAVVFADLDDFKAINDTAGHEAGDEVLKAVSKRFKACVRESDTVARLGGDEFALILANQPSVRYTSRMIDRLRQSLAEPVIAGNEKIDISASIGVSVFPHDGTFSETLLHAADTAMYHSKNAGKNNCQFFSNEMRSSIDAKRKLETAMRNALEREEFFLVFQPKVCLKTFRYVGAEVLLRWQHPEQGLLLPFSFMSTAEESGLIIPLGEWVLANTCTMLERVGKLGFDRLVASINVSAAELGQKNYVTSTIDKLHAKGILPARLGLEIAEDILMRNPQVNNEILNGFRQAGVHLTIDDFGAGFSNLSCLQRFHVNHLKIDRALINNIGLSDEGAVTAKAAIALGHSFNIGVIAQGVETGEQISFLKTNLCDQLQGNRLSEPLRMGEFEQLLKQLGDVPVS